MVKAETWSWSEEAFIRAWEAGVFGDQRVEMVQGEVWPVSIGPWHGIVAARLIRALPEDGWQVTLATLPAVGSLPDPDAWVMRRGAEPVSRLGETGRLARWSPADVALVVEISDTSLFVDTEVKSKVYGAAGYPVYWVLHRGGAEVFTDPFEAGYRRRDHVPNDGELPVPYANVRLAVADILDAPE
ncbi:MAG: Uma2 family endonuclease [Acidimicrobiia bacterium]